MKEVFPEKFSLKQTHFHETFCIFVKCYILTAECFLEGFWGFFPNNCHDKALMDARCGFDNLDNRETHQLKNNIKYLGLILEEPTAHTDTDYQSQYNTSDHYSAILTM